MTAACMEEVVSQASFRPFYQAGNSDHDEKTKK